MGEEVSMKKLAQKLKDSGVNISKVDLAKSIKYYEEGRKLERKRLSTTKKVPIDSLKKGKPDLTGFTTIFNPVEFPKAM